MGAERKLEHRDAPTAPLAAPGPVAEHAEQSESPVPIPGLALPADPIRRSATDPLGGSAVDPATAQALQHPRGGRRLDDVVRSSMESAFQSDFSAVRVHTGPDAAQLSSNVQATAFTHGSDIYFGKGAYDPTSDSGKHLIAHELTHVVQGQQGRDNGGPARSAAPTIGKADDPLEAEAEAVASTVVGALRRQTRGCTCGQAHS